MGSEAEVRRSLILGWGFFFVSETIELLVSEVVVEEFGERTAVVSVSRINGSSKSRRSSDSCGWQCSS